MNYGYDKNKYRSCKFNSKQRFINVLWVVLIIEKEILIKRNINKTFNNNHINVNYTVEVYLEMLLDTKMIYKKNSITTKVYRDKRMLPVYWSSQIPKRYNRNAITSDLNAATRMVSVPGNEIPEIKRKFLSTDYPLRFINSVIKQFSQKSSEMDDFIVPSSLFEILKKIVFLEIPCFPKNIKLLQSDLPKGLMNLQIFHMVYVWITKR